MEHWVHDVFGVLCGQPGGRTWAPGGDWLPFCQRCAGLYVGGLWALALHLVCRAPPGPGLRWSYFVGLLQLGLAGLHWIPDWPTLRTISGAAFGFGVVGFLWSLPQEKFGCAGSASRTRLGWLGLGWLAGVCGLLWAAQAGGQVTGKVLTWVGVAGAASLVLLLIVNLLLLLGPHSFTPWPRRVLQVRPGLIPQD